MQVLFLESPFVEAKLAELQAKGLKWKGVIAFTYEEGGEVYSGALFIPPNTDKYSFEVADMNAAKAVNLALLELPRIYRKHIWHTLADSLHGSKYDDKAPQNR